MINANNNTNKGFKKNKTSNKTNYKANANHKAKQVNNNNNNNILASALIDYVSCIDSVSNICIKYNITRQAFYKYKSKLAGFYNIDYDMKHKQSKRALYSVLMVLEHVNNFAKSNNTLLDYAGKTFYSNIQNLLNTKRHDKLGNNIDKLAKSDVFNDVLSNDNAILQASNDVMIASNEINTLETELILNDSIASNSIASNDLLLSSEISQDKANNKALNVNDVIIDF